MISLKIAQELRASGLYWQPQLHDFFTVPGTDFADRSFVIADMLAQTEVLKGFPAITFNGAVEWALDYVFAQETLWLPTESQLRSLLVEEVGAECGMTLGFSAESYTLTITFAQEPLTFSAPTASDAYGQALLAWLNR